MLIVLHEVTVPLMLISTANVLALAVAVVVAEGAVIVA